MEQEELIAKIRSGKLVQPPAVQAQIYEILREEFLPRLRVMLLDSKDAEELTQISLDMFEPASGRPGAIWRDATNARDPEGLRCLRKTYRVRVRWEELQKFRADLGVVFRLGNGPRQHNEAQRKLRAAQTEGEKALWQSVVDAGSSTPHQPIGAVCKFGKHLYERSGRDNEPPDCCSRRECRKGRDAKRKREDYQNPAVRRKKKAAVARRRRLLRVQPQHESAESASGELVSRNAENASDTMIKDRLA